MEGGQDAHPFVPGTACGRRLGDAVASGHRVGGQAASPIRSGGAGEDEPVDAVKAGHLSEKAVLGLPELRTMEVSVPETTIRAAPNCPENREKTLHCGFPQN